MFTLTAVEFMPAVEQLNPKKFIKIVHFTPNLYFYYYIYSGFCSIDRFTQSKTFFGDAL